LKLRINLRKLKLRKQLKEIKAMAGDKLEKLFRIKERLLIVRDSRVKLMLGELVKELEQDSRNPEVFSTKFVRIWRNCEFGELL
jgi:hypothetical protein